MQVVRDRYFGLFTLLQSTTSKFQLHSNLKVGSTYVLTKLVTAGVSLSSTVVEHTVAHVYLAHDDAQEARNT